MRAALVAGLHQQLGVCPHERGGHGDRVPLGQHEFLAPVAELLDHAEQVVPAARVQPGAVVTQLVEDLLHLERRRDGLDQHRGPDCAARDAQGVLGQVEGIVPEPGLPVALDLGQVEVGAGALLQLAAGAVEEIQGEVEQAPRDPLAVHQHVLLVQVPAAGPDHDRGQVLVRRQLVGLAFLAGEVQRAVQRADEVELARDHVVPQRRVRVLEVGEPHLRPGVERVDGHLPVGRAGDLDPPVDQARGRGGHPPPGVIPDGLGRGQEVQRAAGRQLHLPRGPGRQQLRAPRAELPLQRGHQADRARGENLVEPVPHRTGDLHALAGHTALLPGHPPPRGHRAMLLASNDGGRCQSRALLILGFVTLRPGTGQSVPGHVPGTTWAARVFIQVSVSRRHDSIGRPLDRTACTRPR